MTASQSTVPSWYQDLHQLPSRGSMTPKAQSLADLHRARQSHWGQIWTTTDIAAFMWGLVEQTREVIAPPAGVRLSILDNCIGSGRLIQFATPDAYEIHGNDIDGRAIDALSSALDAQGFFYSIHQAGMEAMRHSGFDIAVLNPPFTIHVESPLLEPSCVTTHGRFGPGTSTLSHIYALAQSLAAASYVIALMPASSKAEVSRMPYGDRLIAVFDLPHDAFATEGANVATSVLVFAPSATQHTALRHRVTCMTEPAPQLDWGAPPSHRRHAKSTVAGIDLDEPSIVTPVTGDRTVRVVRSGRTLRLKYACGLVEARVQNAILVGPIIVSDDDKRRLPQGVRYLGQGKLDIEILLSQPDPLVALDSILREIRDHGGEPRVDSSVRPYLAARRRGVAIRTEPLRHTILVPAGTTHASHLHRTSAVTARPQTKQLMDGTRWGSPVLTPQDTLTFEPEETPEGERFVYKRDGWSLVLSCDQLLTRFDIDRPEASVEQWETIHAGRRAAFPELAARYTERAKRMGLDRWLSYGFQFDDLIELALSRGGVVAGWQMGLGKARLAVALAMLMGVKHSLIVLQANLIDEFVSELETLGVPGHDWQTITRADQTRALRRLNLISYSRLRLPLHRGAGKYTYAAALRRRCAVVIADEGDLISNNSQQVRALFQLSPRIRYALSGTPIGNYPRDILALAHWVKGDGLADQPFGKRRPFIQPALFRSMRHAERGVDVFRHRHVTTEWVTHQWAEDMSEGAKREVPALSGLDQYREFVSALVLRRVWEEPEVSQYIRIPKAVRSVESVAFDPVHLSHYLQTADEFASWWKDIRIKDGGDPKHINLVSILARLGAVFQAANNPQMINGPGAGFHGLTSKQSYTLDLIQAHERGGHQTLVFATSPGVLARLNRLAREAGLRTEIYTGRESKAQRRAALASFRSGDAQTLLLTYGVGQKGINLPQADRIICYNRCYSPRQESQAIYRALRPQQRRELQVIMLHLTGSIDEYMAQMCDMKVDAARAGLDHGTPEFSPDSFQHWITILDRFVVDLCERTGYERIKLNEALKLNAE